MNTGVFTIADAMSEGAGRARSAIFLNTFRLTQSHLETLILGKKAAHRQENEILRKNKKEKSA